MDAENQLSLSLVAGKFECLTSEGKSKQFWMQTIERIGWLFEGEISIHIRTAWQAYEWTTSLDVARQPVNIHALFSPMRLLLVPHLLVRAELRFSHDGSTWILVSENTITTAASSTAVTTT